MPKKLLATLFLLLLTSLAMAATDAKVMSAVHKEAAPYMQTHFDFVQNISISEFKVC